MNKLSWLLIFTAIFGIMHNYLEACRIVPRPPVIVPEHRPVPVLPITVQSHKFNTTIKDGVAVTVLESVFYNPNHRILEGTYLFPLPKGASVSQFSLWIDGKEMPAELLDSTKARNLYESIVRKMIDPALLEFVGRETFKMRVFPLPARGTRKIKLSYREILPVDGNLTRYVYPLTTVGNGRDDTLAKLSWEVKIDSQIPIQGVFSPSHKVKVVKEDKSATISFDATNAHPNRDFVLYISRSMKKVDMSFVPFRKKDKKGYFMMMLAPKPKIDQTETNPKDVIFVVDTSGSMVGDKISQAQASLKYCLHQLSPADRFNIITFSTEATRYKDALLDASKTNVKNALEFVEEEVYARGGTNIDEALNYALQMAPKAGQRPFMVIFLTDGKPTIGIIDPEAILKGVKKQTAENLRLFTFGIGEKINTKLLDRLAEENRGAREYVGSQEDIEVKVSSFFDKVSSPVLSNIEIEFPSGEQLRVSEMYPRRYPDLFKGSRITLLGRYSGSGDQAIKVKGIINGKSQEFVFETSFPEQATSNDQIPHLWAVRKVGFLLDQIRLHGENDELKKEVVRLAKKFGIVTPYTSYLVVEDTATQAVTRRTERERVISRRFRAGLDDHRAPQRAKTNMRRDTGRSAVETSNEFKQMKKAEVMAPGAYTNNKGGGKAQNTIRKVAEKTFYLENGVWYDSEYQEKTIDSLPKTKVEYLSDQYFNILKNNPEIGKFFALGSKVIVVWEKHVYIID